MQDETFKNLSGALSEQRISAYRTHTCKTHADVVCRYVWNVALCEALYPVLNTLEVGLRNASDRALTVKFGKQWLADDHLGFIPWQRETIEQARSELNRLSKPCEHGRLVAELSFGFWTSLYNRGFEQTWHGVLKHAFPNLPGTIRTRRTIANRLDELRRFRNRVFHHERIIHQPFMRLHSEIHQTIEWMNGDLSTLVLTCDRIQAVYENGPHAYDRPIAAAFASNTDL